ncbi:MAG: dihydropteroate synthase [Dehalococcoidia bacterium]|nr:dihydropteroate synthase [Dehalococcoidia bacterium]
METSDITRCGNSLFRWRQRTYIMGIINLSPDSFSGDGLDSLDSARRRAIQMVKEGADIIDVGGESTRPDADSISADEEKRRVIPFISSISRDIGVPVSIDTYKYEVAAEALNAGACMINDICGNSVESGMVKLAAEKNMPIVLTGNQRGKKITDILEAVTSQLKDLIERSIACGVRPENIIVDPGVGFGKTVEQNLEIVRRLDEIRALGYPVLLGTSRKSFIAATVGSSQEERFMGTAASLAIGITRGADLVRVHDVRQMKMICRMSDAIMGRNSSK